MLKSHGLIFILSSLQNLQIHGVLGPKNWQEPLKIIQTGTSLANYTADSPWLTPSPDLEGERAEGMEGPGGGWEAEPILGNSIPVRPPTQAVIDFPLPWSHPRKTHAFQNMEQCVPGVCFSNSKANYGPSNLTQADFLRWPSERSRGHSWGFSQNSARTWSSQHVPRVDSSTAEQFSRCIF